MVLVVIEERAGSWYLHASSTAPPHLLVRAVVGRPAPGSPERSSLVLGLLLLLLLVVVALPHPTAGYQRLTDGRGPGMEGWERSGDGCGGGRVGGGGRTCGVGCCTWGRVCDVYVVCTRMKCQLK